MKAYSTACLAIGLVIPLQTVIADESSYPAPPGYYGQEEILRNAQLNMGKGAPYISIIESQPESASPPDEAPAQPSARPANQSQDNLLIRQPLQPPASPTGIQNKAQQQPWSQTQSSATGNYPNADELAQQYQQAGQWGFEQWGFEQRENQPTQSAPGAGQQGGRFDLTLPVQQGYYDYPRPMSNTGQRAQYPDQNTGQYSNPYPAAGQVRGSPDLARFFEQTPAGWQQFTQPGNLHNNAWKAAQHGLVPPASPPVNMHLQRFDQFPVPQTLYGGAMPGYSSPAPTQSMSGNARYFKPIPREEIIYPPHYPGNR